jgi:carbon-monoxide dehydrogenase medium subunit
MHAFELDRPATLEDAVALLQAGARPLAGGQTLIASMKLRLSAPGRLADLSRLPGLAGVRMEGTELVIGAMTRHADVAADPLVRRHCPALASLAARIGDRQVRAMGTIGGSVANNDPAACYPSAVLGLGAQVQTDRRSIAADDFFQGLFTTALEDDELITALRFPAPLSAAYCKQRQSASHFPLVGVFVARFTDGVRVAVTGGGDGVYREAALERVLGADFQPTAVDAAVIDTTRLGSDLHASAAYRAQLVRTLCRRAVTEAAACR